MIDNGNQRIANKILDFEGIGMGTAAKRKLEMSLTPLGGSTLATIALMPYRKCDTDEII